MAVAEQGDPHYSYHLLLGCVFLLDHAETNAQQEFDAALELEPASPEANFLMAVVLSNLADVSGAYRRIEAALEAAPRVYVFFLLRARLRESRNDPVELIRRDLEEAATLAGGQADAIRGLLRTKYPTSD
jgi:Tfp pilus assembly protein PilF